MRERERVREREKECERREREREWYVDNLHLVVVVLDSDDLPVLPVEQVHVLNIILQLYVLSILYLDLSIYLSI